MIDKAVERESEHVRMPGDGDLRALVAKGIHDARCFPESNHAPGEYWRCVQFYGDHADLALDAIDEAGMRIVSKESTTP